MMIINNTTIMSTPEASRRSGATTRRGATSRGRAGRRADPSGPGVPHGWPGGTAAGPVGVQTTDRRGPGPANHPTPLPYWAKNRTQRVPNRSCASCDGPVFRARRGPAPRYCVACALRLRRVSQLRAYLRSAERLATALDRPLVGGLVRAALVELDGATGS